MPNYTFFMLFLGSVKIKYIAIFYVFMSFIGSTGGNAGGEIAHLGGAFVGWMYITQLNKGRDMGAWIISFVSFFKSMFKPQPKIKVTHRRGNKRPVRKALQGLQVLRSQPSQKLMPFWIKFLSQGTKV